VIRSYTKLLFVINHFSGRNKTDWEAVIGEHFRDLPFNIKFYRLPKSFDIETVKSEIESFKPQRVVAVGGDGTANLVASCIRKTDMSLGIVPAGSANGMAKELGISEDIPAALKIIEEGFCKRISLIEINDRISLHLSDIGLNAHMLREFETKGTRGLIGYLLATVKVLGGRSPMDVEIRYKNEIRNVRADIILIANATMYGTGVVVNPVGKLDDNVFEIVVVKDLTVKDLLNSSLHTFRLDENKSEIIQVSEMQLRSKKPVHFQVDGEYLGKIQAIKAKLLPDSLNVITPHGVNL
jgi:diacylglycerol kinase (ATP)